MLRDALRPLQLYDAATAFVEGITRKTNLLEEATSRKEVLTKMIPIPKSSRGGSPYQVLFGGRAENPGCIVKLGAESSPRTFGFTLMDGEQALDNIELSYEDSGLINYLIKIVSHSDTNKFAQLQGSVNPKKPVFTFRDFGAGLNIESAGNSNIRVHNDNLNCNVTMSNNLMRDLFSRAKNLFKSNKETPQALSEETIKTTGLPQEIADKV